MPHSTVKLTADDVDDLVYFSRAGDLDSLKDSIEALSKVHSCPSYSILLAAIDVDEEGLGSGSCLLHYPAANGNIEIVRYLLALIKPEATKTVDAQSEEVTAAQPYHSKPSPDFVNHQNVSGNTPLHWAGMNGHLQVVQALVGAGANPEIVNSAGRDAVVESEWSSKDGANDCGVWILKECGALEKGLGESQAGGEGSETTLVDAEDNDEGEEKADTDEANGQSATQSST